MLANDRTEVVALLCKGVPSWKEFLLKFLLLHNFPGVCRYVMATDGEVPGACKESLFFFFFLNSRRKCQRRCGALCRSRCSVFGVLAYLRVLFKEGGSVRF